MRTRSDWARRVAGAGAAIGGFALALQFALLERQMGAPLAALWRFVGYFTILSNVFAVATLTAAVWRRRPVPPRVELAAATAIAMVGLVYTLLLRATWDPKGWPKIADMLLHDAAPLLVVAYFLLAPRPTLKLRDASLALGFPLLYVVYAMTRGAADGWYAYWFLDPRALGLVQMSLSLALLTAAFLAMSLLLTLLSNRLNALPRARNSR